MEKIKADENVETISAYGIGDTPRITSSLDKILNDARGIGFTESEDLDEVEISFEDRVIRGPALLLSKPKSGEKAVIIRTEYLTIHSYELYTYYPFVDLEE